MKTISLVILLSLGLFVGDFFAANGGTGGTGGQSGGTNQNSTGTGQTGGRTGVTRSFRTSQGQGGVSNGSIPASNPSGTQRGAGALNVGQSLDIRNLNQNQLQSLLQNRVGGANNLTVRTNQGIVNLTAAQLSQLNSDRVLQLLTTLNGTNNQFSGVNVSNLSDANLRTRLFDMLDDSGLGSQVNLQVRDGVVTLSGFVVTQSEADQLIQLLNSVNLRSLNLQGSDLRLQSNPDTNLIANTGTGQLVVNPQTGVVTNVPLSPSSLTRIGNNTETTGDLRAGTDINRTDPRLAIFGNQDPRAGNNQTDLLRNFNSPTDLTTNTNTVNTTIGTGNTTNVNRRSNISDTDLRLAILDLMDAIGISTNNVIVESNGGTITVSGLASPADTDRIIQLIRSLNVDQINLNLTLVR